MDLSSPTINYVGSVDTSTSAAGSTKYSILFDESVATLGNVIMFEYKLQDQGSLTTPANVYLKYVTIENAIQSGIVNQYILSVPAIGINYDPTIAKTIQFRVYSGVLGSNEVAVTDWSNPLDVHVPPNKQSIYTAFYDSNSYGNQDELYVLLDVDNNVSISGANAVKFIVCYYYPDSTNTTVWNVSQPLTATPVTVNSQTKWLLHETEFGTVSDTNQVVYVSVHAVFEFVHELQNYYSVSEVSDTVTAIPASDSYAPTITDIHYNVYDSAAPGGEQTMDITWTPPVVSIIPAFVIDHYILEYTTNGGTTWSVIDNNISPTPSPSGTVTYSNFSVADESCGTTVGYRVQAVSTFGSYGQWSNIKSKNIFKFSEAVQSLFVSNTSYDIYTNEVTLTVNFTKPNNIGCGTGLRYVVEITTDYGFETNYITYNSTQTTYAQTYSGNQYLQSGTVTVYLQTQDTNETTLTYMNGAEASTSYLAIDYVLNAITYNVYSNGNSDQTFNLSWTTPVLSPWTIVEYYSEVQITPPTGPVVPYDRFDTSANTNSTYNASTAGTDNAKNRLDFRVIAKMRNDTDPLNPVFYEAYSNVQSYNIFKYSDAVSNGVLNWSVAVDGGTSLMDMNLQFKNPTNTGINNGLAYFRVNVMNSAGLSTIATVDVLPNTNSNQPSGVSYNSGTGLYTIRFNDIPYSASGNVKIYSFVNNDNTNTTPPSDAILTNNTVFTLLGYTTGTIPIFQDVGYNLTLTSVTGKIISYQPLKPVGQVLYPSGTMPPINSIQYQTGGGTTGFAISYIQESNGVYVYSFTITLSTFFPSGPSPSGFSIAAANDSGIGIGRI